MEIQRNTVYEHSEYGEILVLGIHRSSRKYDSETDNGAVDAVVVKFSDDWDAFGPMFSHILATSLTDFVEFTGDALHVEKYD